MTIIKLQSSIPSVWVETGYKPLTTLWNDFSIADAFGLQAIKETYTSGLDYAKNDYKNMTELVLVLNHKCWQHYEKDNDKSMLYSDLYYAAQDAFFDLYRDNQDACEYYYRTTD